MFTAEEKRYLQHLMLVVESKASSANMFCFFIFPMGVKWTEIIMDFVHLFRPLQ